MTTLQLIVIIVLVLVVVAWWLYSLGIKNNEVDWGGKWLACIDGLNRVFCRRFHRLPVTTLDLPEKGGCIIASNHVSGLDPLVLIASSKRPLRFMIAREEYERFGLQWLFRGVGCIPVERSARPEQALREALRTLQAGEVVALFPHGKIHLDSDPKRKVKKGVAWLSHQANVPVHPFRLSGITGEGHTILSVFIRSKVKIDAFDSIHCEAMSNHDCLEKIASCIEGRQV